MIEPLESRLAEFVSSNQFKTKGPLCVALIVTEHAREKGLPLDPGSLVTDGRGQVQGLGKSAVQAILKRHGIVRVLAEEGGRTSRGSLGNMERYVEFLNSLAESPDFDLNAIERFWISRVLAYFSAKPFRIKMDSSKSLRNAIADLVAQAETRQKETPGLHYLGIVLQHIVGAKLDCILSPQRITHHSYSTSDAQTGRVGDFSVGDVAIHVTTAPGEALVRRCEHNLSNNVRPVVVTISQQVAVVRGLAGNQGIADRLDVFEVEQFVTTNLYEWGKFSADGRRDALTGLIERYNEIVDEVETDPSLRIEMTIQR